MSSTYSNLKFQLMTTGENNTTWGDVTNLNLGTAIEEAIVGSADVTFASANVTLTLTDTNASQTARNLRLNCTGTTGGARNLVVPAIEKFYIVNNGCADAITVKNATGTGVAVPAGSSRLVFNNGTNVVDAVTSLGALVGDLQFGGTAQRILGDFSNATVSSRLTFQSSGTNQNTAVNAIPSGTATQTNFVCFNSSSPDNAAFMSIAATATDARLVSSTAGSGTIIPMTFYVGGSERARIDTSGNVGVGTTSPGAKLDVSSSTSNIVISRSTGGYAAFQRIAPSGQQAHDFYTINGTEAGRITVDGANFMAFSTGAAATERMRIDTSGNVGIGTASPSYKLDVQTSTSNTEVISRVAAMTGASAASTLLLNTGTANSYVVHKLSDYSGAPLYAIGGGPAVAAAYYSFDTHIWSNQSGTERMRIDSSGNVGIGTAAPAAKLSIDRGSSGQIFTFKGAGGTFGFASGVLGGTNACELTTTDTGGVQATRMMLRGGTDNADIEFYRGARGAETISMFIEGDNGNVGIGTSAPQGQTEIRTATGGTVTNALVISNYVSASVNTGVALHFDPNGAGSLARTASIQSVQSTSGNYADLRFFTANSTTPAEYFRIAAGGAFGLSGANYGTSGQVLTSQGSGSAPIWSTITPGTGTVTSVSFTGGIVSVGTPTSTPAFTVAGTSGGIPYFSSASTWATSAALAANALVIGGGAGVAPATTTTGTGVVTALGVNTGTAGAFVVNGGALGTPSSGTLTNCTFPTLNQNTTGSAATLTTARTLTIGATGKTFNGSANVTWTLAELGAAASGANTDITSLATTTTINGVTIGYRSIPRSTTTTTAVVGDVGKCIAVSAGITIPNSTFAAGDAVSIYNDSASAVTITAGVTTLRLAGTATTGNRTLAARGMATVWFNSATEAVISGAGVT